MTLLGSWQNTRFDLNFGSFTYVSTRLITHGSYKSHEVRKRTVLHIAYAEKEGLDQTALAQFDQGLHCPFAESLDIVKYFSYQRSGDRFGLN